MHHADVVMIGIYFQSIDIAIFTDLEDIND